MRHSDTAPTPTGFGEFVGDSSLRIPLPASRFHALRTLFERDVLNVSRNPPDVAKRVFHPTVAFPVEGDVRLLHHSLAAGLDRPLIHAVTIVDVKVDRGGHSSELGC